MDAQYPADCPSRASVSGEFGAGMLVVTDLNDPSQNTRGCAWANATANPNGNDGKFTIRLGDNISLSSNPNGALQQNPLTAQIDLHQIGAGFLGHFYFTHTYNGTGVDSATETLIQGGDEQPALTEQADGVPTDVQHKVVGMWTPDITAADEPDFGLWTVYASLPDHGANAPDVTYHIDFGEDSTGQPSGTRTCNINQDSAGQEDQTGGGNRFVDIGTYALDPGADVWLDNMVTNTSAGDPMNGTKDVAFGSLIFVPGASPITPRRPLACRASGVGPQRSARDTERGAAGGPRPAPRLSNVDYRSLRLRGDAGHRLHDRHVSADQLQRQPGRPGLVDQPGEHGGDVVAGDLAAPGDVGQRHQAGGRAVSQPAGPQDGPVESGPGAHVRVRRALGPQIGREDRVSARRRRVVRPHGGNDEETPHPGQLGRVRE